MYIVDMKKNTIFFFLNNLPSLNERARFFSNCIYTKKIHFSITCNTPQLITGELVSCTLGQPRTKTLR